MYTFLDIARQKRLKWNLKTTEGIHIEYSEEIKCCRIWYPSRNRINMQRDVIFEKELIKEKNKKEKEVKRKIMWIDVCQTTSRKTERKEV